MEGMGPPAMALALAPVEMVPTVVVLAVLELLAPLVQMAILEMRTGVAEEEQEHRRMEVLERVVLVPPEKL